MYKLRSSHASSYDSYIAIACYKICAHKHQKKSSYTPDVRKCICVYQILMIA